MGLVEIVSANRHSLLQYQYLIPGSRQYILYLLQILALPWRTLRHSKNSSFQTTGVLRDQEGCCFYSIWISRKCWSSICFDKHSLYSSLSLSATKEEGNCLVTLIKLRIRKKRDCLGDYLLCDLNHLDWTPWPLMFKETAPKELQITATHDFGAYGWI